MNSLNLERKVSHRSERVYRTGGSYTVPVNVQLPGDCALEADVSVKIELQGKRIGRGMELC